MNKQDTSSNTIFYGILICLASSFAPGNTSAANHADHETSPNFTAQENPYLNSPYRPHADTKHIAISSAAQLQRELVNANNTGYVSFFLEDGVYQVDRTLEIRADNISLISKSGDSENVIIQGSNKPNTGTPVLIKVLANHFSIDGITLQNASSHLIQVAGEHDADYPVIRNCVIRDSYQQLVKISYDLKKADTSSDFGLIENTSFQYSDGIGPNYYIGGIDLHAGNSWIIRNNKFKDIASPGGSIAEHAIHAWNNAYNTIVENNIIEDCDRAIGFGLFAGKKHPSIVFSHQGGIIRNNLILHSINGDPFADTGIILEGSAKTLIENNRIWLEHDYPNAIEYRFPPTKNVIIKNNVSNKNIASRNGGSARLSNNTTSAEREAVLEGHINNN